VSIGPNSVGLNLIFSLKIGTDFVPIIERLIYCLFLIFIISFNV
jgi:hypothetical protein